MGKTNVFTLLTTVIMQFVVGYLWYGTQLFGDVMGTHAINFLKLDVISLLLIILTSYGLTHVLSMLIGVTGTKDVGGALKLGLTVGGFAIGLPVIMLLNFMGFSHIVLLVVFTYIVLITFLTNVIILKLKHA